MSFVWTAHLRCFACDKDFVVNRVSVADASAAATLIPCPHCGAASTASRPHRLNYLQRAGLPYRRKNGCEVWHFSAYCSHWPLDDFVELDFPPAEEVCNECRALVGT